MSRREKKHAPWTQKEWEGEREHLLGRWGERWGGERDMKREREPLLGSWGERLVRRERKSLYWEYFRRRAINKCKRLFAYRIL